MEWNWKNFTQKKIACRGTICGCNHELWDVSVYGHEPPEYFIQNMNMLQKLRDAYGVIPINSGHRCKKHNAMTKNSSPKSQHLKIAFDCRIKKQNQKEFIEIAKKVGFTGIGVYNSFVHLDAGIARQW